MIYSLIEYGLLTITCVYLVNYYANREVSLHVKVWSVITWVLNFGLALLVPQDVYITLQNIADQQYKDQLGQQYLLLYWLVYILTWTIIPVLQEWEDAGDIQSQARMKRSLRINGYFYLVLLVGAIVALAAIWFVGAADQMGLIIFLKCLATIWGMLLLMGLLGYSLVQVPRTMWRNADPQAYLGYLYQRVYQMEEEVQQAKKDFKLIAAYISYVRKHTTDPQILRYCTFSSQLITSRFLPLVKTSYQRVITQTNYLTDYPISLQSSIEHNRLMKRVLARIRRQQHGLSDYINQSILYQDIIKSINEGSPLKTLVRRSNTIISWWYVKVRPKCDKIFAGIIGTCCVVLLISQSQIFFSKHWSLMAYLLLFENKQVIRVMVFLVMGFIIYMSNYALFRLKLANLYGLYRKQSDGASLMFATVNFSRIGVAIVLNFFDMLKMEQGSIYSQVMQAPSMGLLGQWVIKGLPGLLWIIVLTHYFNVWGWLAKKLKADGRYAFYSHEINRQSSKMSSPLLVLQRRKELQQKYQQNLFDSIKSF